MWNIIQTRSCAKSFEGVSKLLLSGYEGRAWCQRRPLGTSPKRRLDRTNPKSELTSRFERIENVKNFDVEKSYNFNFLFAESFKWACVKENANENDFCLRLQNVVVKMMLGAWKIKLF